MIAVQSSLRRIVFLAPLAALVAALTAVAQTRSSTIPVSEIHRGMHGYGLTVFEGETPARFDVDVIDVLSNFRPDQDLILIRTTHPILEHATVVAGMSGSPVYLDGRLAGAYAYGWPFGKDPVAGVTPIANMMAEAARPLRYLQNNPLAPLSARTPVTGDRFAGLPAYRGERRGAFDSLSDHVNRLGLGDASPSNISLIPVATPLLVGGMSDRTLAALGDALAPFGMEVLQAGGGGHAVAAPSAHFVDGGAIGVQLVRGDVSMTAVGTVTHVDGHRLVAFGHPMTNAGEVGLPTCTARVLHVLASEQRSFKVAEAVSPLGTLVNDRQAAIVIDAQRTAVTIPVTVRLRGVDGTPRTEWHMEVASHRALTPLLVVAALTNALEAAASDQTDVMITAHEHLRIEGHPEVALDDDLQSLAGPASPRALGSMRLFSALEAVYANPFEEARIAGVDVELEIHFARDARVISEVRVASDDVDPGQRVPVQVRLRRYGAPDEVRVVPVDIPVEAAGTEMELSVLPGDDVPLEHAEPRSLDDMLANVRDALPSTSLVVSLRLPSRGLRFEGHVVRQLPGSALDALTSANASDPPTSFATDRRVPVDVGHVLMGSARVRLHVRTMARQR